MPLEKARLHKLNANGDVDNNFAPVEAHFNPETLSLSYEATGPDSSSRNAAGSANGARTGTTSQRTGFVVKLSSLQLMFDTSEFESDRDVRNITLRIAELIQAEDDNSAPGVCFSWGTFLFKGTINSMSENLEYFSEEGMPLRASVTLQMSMNEAERANNRASGGGTGAGAGAGLGASAGISAGISAGVGVSAGFSAGISASAGVGVSAGVSVGAGASVGTTPLTFSQSGESLQSLAGRAGADWKVVAEANGIDNPRMVQTGTAINLKVGKS